MQHATAISVKREPSGADVHEALGRITNSATFRTAPRLVCLLRFVVKYSLAGEGARLKGYTIAVEAFGRRPDFDPQIDPIVRVEAGRLRQRLGRYYGGEGAGETIVIDLPRGGYVPVFRLREVLPHLGTSLAHGLNDGGFADAALHQLVRLCRHRLQALAMEIALVEAMIAQAHACRDTRARAEATVQSGIQSCS